MGPSGRKKETHPGTRRRPGSLPLLARTGRFRVVTGFVLIAFASVAARLWWLQYYDAQRLASFADKARGYSRVSRAERGQIRDSHDTVLAKSREIWDIGVDPVALTPENEAGLDRIVAELSRILKIPSSELLRICRHKIRDEGERSAADTGSDDSDEDVSDGTSGAASKVHLIRWARLATGVNRETRDAVVAKMAELRVKAVYPSPRYERDYPYGKLASQLIGYVNKEGRPAMGIEKAFDFFLKGADGWIDSQRDGKKREAPDQRIREVRPRDGCNIILTLDANIQQLVEEELGKTCEAYRPEWGIAIVSEAKTGRLLALTNWPTFDLNDYSDLTKSPLVAQKNRAVTDVYEPGSVFKIVSYSAALQEGLITPDTMVRRGPDYASPFLVPYKGNLYRLPKDDREGGWVDLVDVRKAVAKSSNRAAAQIAMRVAEVCGEQKLWDYMAGFGFGSRTGLVTGSEVRGTLKKPSEWNWSQLGADITRMPMGHSVDVTALQTHYAMGVVASGGDLLMPQLVSRIVDRAGETVCEFDPVVRKHVISKETAMTVANLLRGVVSKDGTGKEAVIPGYDVAGKTGTTAIYEQNPQTGKWGYSGVHNIASFCGFFPAENPQIVISVIMKNPSGKAGQRQAFGGAYSAPVFKSIAEHIIRQYKIPPINPAEYDAEAERLRKKAGLPPSKPARPAAPALSFGDI